MIVLFTDYGDDLYIGQLHAAIRSRLPDIPMIDLLHDAPQFNITAGAVLLAAYTAGLPSGSVIVAVVDPGVGSERPHGVIHADGRWYVGPDNGLFDLLAREASEFQRFHFSWDEPVSATFHGRDVYAPMACRLAAEGPTGLPLRPGSMPPVTTDVGGLDQIVYLDHFGNAITGLRAGPESADAVLNVKGVSLMRARKFSDVAVGESFWYANSNGLVEIAVREGSARDLFDLAIGERVELAPAGGPVTE